MMKITVWKGRLILFIVMRIGRERVSWTGIRFIGSLKKDKE
jgi:hypothetical protein